EQARDSADRARLEAVIQTKEAEKQTREAAKQAIEAEKQTRAAEQERDSANQARRISKANESQALAALSRVASMEGRINDALKLGIAAWPRRESDDRPRLEATLTNISRTLHQEKPFVRKISHDLSVRGAVLTKDESRILSWSADKSLRLWDTATGQ